MPSARLVYVSDCPMLFPARLSIPAKSSQAMSALIRLTEPDLHPSERYASDLSSLVASLVSDSPMPEQSSPLPTTRVVSISSQYRSYPTTPSRSRRTRLRESVSRQYIPNRIRLCMSALIYSDLVRLLASTLAHPDPVSTTLATAIPVLPIPTTRAQARHLLFGAD